MLACDAVLHPTIFLDQVIAEFHSVSLLLAFRLFRLVSVTLSCLRGAHADERCECKSGSDRCHSVHDVISSKGECLFSSSRHFHSLSDDVSLKFHNNAAS